MAKQISDLGLVRGFLNVRSGQGDLDAADVKDERVVRGLGEASRHRGNEASPGPGENAPVSRSYLSRRPDYGVG